MLSRYGATQAPAFPFCLSKSPLHEAQGLTKGSEMCVLHMLPCGSQARASVGSLWPGDAAWNSQSLSCSLTYLSKPYQGLLKAPIKASNSGRDRAAIGRDLFPQHVGFGVSMADQEGQGPPH